MTGMPPAWMHRVLATIERYGGSDTATFSGLVDRTSLDIKVGEKPFESIPLLNEGRLYKYGAEEDSEISFDMYSKGLGSAAGNLDLFFMGATVSSSGAIQAENTNNRYKHRLTLLFTNDPAPTSATDAVDSGGAGYAARRYIFADCFITTHTANMGDNVLKTSVVAKCPPFDADANPNWKMESLDGVVLTGLAALSAYSGSNKFDVAVSAHKKKKETV